MIASLKAMARERLRSWLLSPQELERLARPVDVPPGTAAPTPPEPFDPDEPANWISLDYIEPVVQAQLDRQSDEWDLVDGRLRLILGVVGIIFAAVLGFQQGPSQLEFHVAVLVIVAVLAFLTVGIIAAVAYWPQNFNRPPDPETSASTSLLMPGEPNANL